MQNERQRAAKVATHREQLIDLLEVEARELEHELSVEQTALEQKQRRLARINEQLATVRR